MAWDRNSVMCVTVGATLIHLDEIDSSSKFSSIGSMQIQDLQFFNNTASSDVNKAAATMLANSFDSILTNSYGDTYQTGYDQNSAIDSMVAILSIGDKTVENFSDAIQQAYLAH